MLSVDRPLADAVVIISDLVEQHPRYGIDETPPPPCVPSPHNLDDCPVQGSYLERLPLSLVHAGYVRFAEIWHHHRSQGVATQRDNAVLTRRAFHTGSDAPFHSEGILDFIRTHGAPRILCVWGLGVSEAILEACSASIIIYNSIDVPALRVPPEISRHFDLVLTGSQWQSDEVRERHSDVPTAILPIGPEFASPETFFPLPEAKDYDIVYVAAAQRYKRHDILFSALARCFRPLRALCVMGYGEDGEHLRSEALRLGIEVDFVGPPAAPYSEVNRLMNRAKLGVVCGIDDGAPAILTEYMLAGLPVVANAELRCGLQYIVPETGLAVVAERFEDGILEALGRMNFAPRQTVLERWSWPHSVRRLGSLIDRLALLRRAEPFSPAFQGGFA